MEVGDQTVDAVELHPRVQEDGGVAAASQLREPVVLATVAGLIAGALSMAAGEYVSVSSQTDTEKADILKRLDGRTFSRTG